MRLESEEQIYGTRKLPGLHIAYRQVEARIVGIGILVFDGFKVGNGFCKMIVGRKRQGKLKLCAERSRLGADLRKSFECGGVFPGFQLALDQSHREGGFPREERCGFAQILRGSRIFATLEGDFAEKGVDRGIVWREFGSFQEMLFGGGVVFEGELVGREIFKGRIELRIELKRAQELTIGGCKVSFLGERDAEEIQGLEVVGLRGE